jgi:hypothetical protein
VIADIARDREGPNRRTLPLINADSTDQKNRTSGSERLSPGMNCAVP